MVLHASILDVVLEGGFQLCELLLGGRVDVVSLPVVRHLDVFQAVLRSNFLVFCGEAHASTLVCSHCER